MIKYQVLDVFTQSSFEGNPVAVAVFYLEKAQLHPDESHAAKQEKAI